MNLISKQGYTSTVWFYAILLILPSFFFFKLVHTCVIYSRDLDMDISIKIGHSWHTNYKDEMLICGYSLPASVLHWHYWLLSSEHWSDSYPSPLVDLLYLTPLQGLHILLS